MQPLIDLLALAAQYEKEPPPYPEALVQPVGAELAALIDHTLLKPEATAGQIKKFCMEAREYHILKEAIEGSGVWAN